MFKKLYLYTILTVAIIFGMTHSIYAIPFYTDWTTATSTSATGTLDGVSVEISSTTDTINPTIFGGFTNFSKSSIYNPARIGSTEAISFQGDKGTVGFDYTVEFGSPVENPVIYIASMASTLTFDPSVSITKINGEDEFLVSANVVTGALDDTKSSPNNDANGIFQLNGIFTDFEFNALWNYPTASGNDGIYIQVASNDVVTNPEPATVTLLGIGLAGLVRAEARRRRKKKVIDKG